MRKRVSGEVFRCTYQEKVSTTAQLPQGCPGEQPGSSTNKSLPGHPKAVLLPTPTQTYYRGSKICFHTPHTSPENTKTKQAQTCSAGKLSERGHTAPRRGPRDLPTAPRLPAAPRTFRRARPPSPAVLLGVVAVTVSPEL